MKVAKTPQALYNPCARRGTNLDSLLFPGPEPFPQPATTVEHPPIPIDLPLLLPHTDSSTPPSISLLPSLSSNPKTTNHKKYFSLLISV